MSGAGPPFLRGSEVRAARFYEKWEKSCFGDASPRWLMPLSPFSMHFEADVHPGRGRPSWPASRRARPCPGRPICRSTRWIFGMRDPHARSVVRRRHAPRTALGESNDKLPGALAVSLRKIGAEARWRLVVSSSAWPRGETASGRDAGRRIRRHDQKFPIAYFFYENPRNRKLIVMMGSTRRAEADDRRVNIKEDASGKCRLMSGVKPERVGGELARPFRSSARADPEWQDLQRQGDGRRMKDGSKFDDTR